LPDDLEINAKIFMDGNISEANDIIPFYPGIFFFNGRRKASASFTDDFKLSYVAKRFSELERNSSSETPCR